MYSLREKKWRGGVDIKGRGIFIRTSASNGTENVSTSTLEERANTLVLENLVEAVDGTRVLHGST